MIRRYWIPTIVFAVTLAAAGMTAAENAQEPQRLPRTEEERRKLFEKLTGQMRQPGVPVPAAPDPAQAPAQPGAPAPALAPIPSIVQRAPIAAGNVQLSYDNADLYMFINQITDTLGISPVIIDPEVKGTVTIHSSAAMSRDDVFPLFSLILKNNNAALVKQGNIYQIVPTSTAIKRGLEIVDHLPGSRHAPRSPGGGR